MPNFQSPKPRPLLSHLYTKQRRRVSLEEKHENVSGGDEKLAATKVKMSGSGRFLQTLVVIFPRKSTQVKTHTKMAIFWAGF